MNQSDTDRSIVPAVHLEYIQNQLDNPASAGAEEVENYHRALFLHHHAVEWETHRQACKTHQDTVGYLETRLKEAEQRLSRMSRFISANPEGQTDFRPNPPWNAWDIAMFCAGSLAILALIGFGIMNISFNLLESGFITFRENPLRAYLWAALLPVGALAVKVGWDLLRDRKKQEIYLWTCVCIGLAGVLAWVVAYAFVYPTLSKGIGDQIASLSVFENGTGNSGLTFGGAKWIDVVTVAAQAIAEIFLSAVLGIYLTGLYAKHCPIKFATDPGFHQVQQERRELLGELEQERRKFGEASGHLIRLENQLAALLAYGKSILHRESARREEKGERRDLILSQLSDHLRQHLDTAHAGSRIELNAPSATAKNGA